MSGGRLETLELRSKLADTFTLVRLSQLSLTGAAEFLTLRVTVTILRSLLMYGGRFNE